MYVDRIEMYSTVQYPHTYIHTYIHRLFNHVTPRSTRDSLKRARANRLSNV